MGTRPGTVPSCKTPFNTNSTIPERTSYYLPSTARRCSRNCLGSQGHVCPCRGQRICGGRSECLSVSHTSQALTEQTPAVASVTPGLRLSPRMGTLLCSPHPPPPEPLSSAPHPGLGFLFATSYPPPDPRPCANPVT